MPPPFDHAGGLLAKLLQSVTKHKCAQMDRQRGLHGPYYYPPSVGHADRSTHHPPITHHHPTRWAHPFKRPVTDKEAPDYKNIIKNPMDLSTLRKRVDSGAVSDIAALVGCPAPSNHLPAPPSNHRPAPFNPALHPPTTAPGRPRPPPSPPIPSSP